MSTIKIFRSGLVTGLLVVLCFSAGYFFLSGYQRYIVNLDKKAALIRQAELLNHRQIDRKQKWQDIMKVNRFVKNAELLGLVRKKWAVYHVDIQDSVNFTEMRKLLTQCTNGDSHYFKPISFHLKSIKAIDNKKNTSGMTSHRQKGDILMVLKGAFFVKNNTGIPDDEKK
ncbi:MAG: hypothetical protein WBY47_05365 [Desulfobacterales bacterium]